MNRSRTTCKSAGDTLPIRWLAELAGVTHSNNPINDECTWMFASLCVCACDCVCMCACLALTCMQSLCMCVPTEIWQRRGVPFNALSIAIKARVTGGWLRYANVSSRAWAFIQYKCHVSLQGWAMSLLSLWIINIHHPTSILLFSKCDASSLHYDLI